MSRCIKTSFIITPHYICSHRNSDNLHNADFIGHSAVGEWRTCTFWWSYASNVGSCFSDDDEDDYEVDDAHGMDDEMTDAYEQFMQQQQNKLQ